MAAAQKNRRGGGRHGGGGRHRGGHGWSGGHHRHGGGGRRHGGGSWPSWFGRPGGGFTPLWGATGPRGAYPGIAGQYYPSYYYDYQPIPGSVAWLPPNISPSQLAPVSATAVDPKTVVTAKTSAKQFTPATPQDVAISEAFTLPAAPMESAFEPSGKAKKAKKEGINWMWVAAGLGLVVVLSAARGK